MTKLNIRVASFGDRNASERMFRQIGSHIPAPTLPTPANGGFAMQAIVGAKGTSIASNAKPLTPTNFVITAPESKPLLIPGQEPPLAGAANWISPATTTEEPVPPVGDPAAGAPKIQVAGRPVLVFRPGHGPSIAD